MKVEFTSLPLDLFDYLTDFLFYRDYRNLLKTFRLLYHEKRHKIKFHLSYFISERFYKDDSFRDHLLKCVKEPMKQLSLILQGRSIASKSKPCMIESPHKLNFIHSLTLLQGDLTNLEGLCNIHTLQITSFSKLTTLPLSFQNLQELSLINCPSLTDIHAIQEVPIIHIENCPSISDISMLGKQIRLTLQKCSGITNISHLSKIHTLSLSSCPQIESVSGLGKVPSLLLMDCPINNFHELTENRCLKLLQYHSILDYSIFNNIIELYFHSCNIADLTVFQYPKSLLTKIAFQQCYELIDANALHYLTTIIFRDCYQLKYIDKLGNIKHLEIDNCPEITSLDGLGHNHHKLYLRSLPKITNFNQLFKVYDITISDCHQFQGIDNAKNHLLRIYNCNQLKSVNMFSNVYHLSIRNCDHIVNIDGLTNVVSLEIKNCSNLVDMKGLLSNNKMKRIELFGCDNIISVEGIENISEVIIKECKHLISRGYSSSTPSLINNIPGVVTRSTSTSSSCSSDYPSK